MNTEILLQVDRICKHFAVRKGLWKSLWSGKREYLRAVDGISIDLRKREILGIIGESGCGKSTLSKLILGLMPPTRGTVRLEETDITSLNRNHLRRMRKRMQMIFQDPHGSLNPRRTVADTIRQTIAIHRLVSTRNEQDTLIRQTLKEVGLRPVESFWDRYPDLLSGGQRQRVGIGRVLVLQPKLIVADEPVSMLDVSVRIGILELLLRLRDTHGISMIFITHDLATARYMCDRIAIMYLGQIVEVGPSEDVLADPLHPYTNALVAAVPVADPAIKVRELPIKGYVPVAPTAEQDGCRFYPRCLAASDRCREQKPQLRDLGNDRFVACCKV